MTATDLWHFVRAQGVQTRDVVALGLGAGLLALAGYGAAYSWRQFRHTLTYAHALSPLIALAIGALCLLVVVFNLRERYLLRPGAGRYTAASIVAHSRRKGQPRYLCGYDVQGQHYQQGGNCGIRDGHELPCPALGSRRFLYFAPEDPAVAQLTAVPVPDTLRQVPALGWARIP